MKWLLLVVYTATMVWVAVSAHRWSRWKMMYACFAASALYILGVQVVFR